MLLGCLQPFACAPGAFVRQAEVLQLAFRLQFLNLAKHIGDLSIHVAGIEVVGIPGPVFAEMIGAAVRPVKLVEIDVIGLKPQQTCFQRLAQDRAGDAGATTHIFIALAGHLGRHHQPVAVRPALQPVSDDFFGQSGGFSATRRGWIHLRSVEEVDAFADCIIELLMRLGLAVLGTPGHGAKAQFGNERVGGSQRIILHERFWKVQDRLGEAVIWTGWLRFASGLPSPASARTRPTHPGHQKTDPARKPPVRRW